MMVQITVKAYYTQETYLSFTKISLSLEICNLNYLYTGIDVKINNILLNTQFDICVQIGQG